MASRELLEGVFLKSGPVLFDAARTTLLEEEPSEPNYYSREVGKRFSWERFSKDRMTQTVDRMLEVANSLPLGDKIALPVVKALRDAIWAWSLNEIADMIVNEPGSGLAPDQVRILQGRREGSRSAGRPR
jgi:hypothetical protein